MLSLFYDADPSSSPYLLSSFSSSSAVSFLPLLMRPPSFLLLYFSLSACLSPFHRRVSAIYFLPRSHVINLHLSQRNHRVPQIYDGDMPDLLKRPRSARDSIFDAARSSIRICPRLLIPFFTVAVCSFTTGIAVPDNADRIFP